MHRDDDRGIAVTELYVTTSLTDFDEARNDERLDNLGSAYDREGRIQAESWNVVTVG